MPMPLELGQLTRQDYNVLQSQLSKFEAAWEKSQTTVDLAQFLPAPEHPLRVLYLRELVKSDMEARWRRKQPIGLEYYLDKFPELGRRATVDVQLVVEEYRIRHKHGDKPRQESYKGRFPNQYEPFQRLLQIEPGTNSSMEKTLVPQPGEGSTTVEAPPTRARSEMGNTTNYKFIKRLGSGAFAEVWLGEAPGGVQVAIKRLIHPMEKDAAQRELDALERTKNLRHPFLLSTYAFWIADDRLHIAMELADCTLRDRMRECQVQGAKGIPREELLNYFRQAAEGLDYLHKAKLVHRDIKPENILLRTGYVKIADFGLAKMLHSARMSASNAAGTLLYMAPEVWNKNVGHASDQYSLALTYAELAQGRHPFENQAKSGGFYGVMVAHQKEDPDLADLPEADRKVLMKALAKEPEQRYPSCRAFVEAISPLSRPVPTPAKQPQGLPLGLGYQLQMPVGNAPLRGIALKALAPDGRSALVTRISLERQQITKRDLDAYLLLVRMEHPNLLPLQAAWILDSENQVVWGIKRTGTVAVNRELPASAITGGTLNLATDLIPETLARRMEQAVDGRRELSPGEAFGYLKQAALVVDYLNARTHQLGNKAVAFRHCAVTPENLFLNEQGVLLGDYSLIQMVDGPSSEVPVSVSGFSATYGAPELFKNQVYDTSDQYSLAVVHYQLSTGTLPFGASTPSQERIEKHRTGQLDFTRLRENERKVISTGAAVDPGMRFLTCSALVKAICEARMMDTPTGTLEPGVVEELLGPGRLGGLADSRSEENEILRRPTLNPPDSTFDEEDLKSLTEPQPAQPAALKPDPTPELQPVSLSEVLVPEPEVAPAAESRQPKPVTQRVKKLSQTQLVQPIKTEASLPPEVRETQLPTPDVRRSWRPGSGVAKAHPVKGKKPAAWVLALVGVLLVAGAGVGGYLVYKAAFLDQSAQRKDTGNGVASGTEPTPSTQNQVATTKPSDTGASTRPSPNKTVQPKKGDAKWQELDKQYLAAHGLLTNKSGLDDAIAGLDKLITDENRTAYPDIVLYATLDRDRAAVGKGDWARVKKDLGYLGEYKEPEVQAWWPYLDLMVRLNLERSSIEKQPASANVALKGALEVRKSSLYDGTKLQPWERDQLERDTGAAAEMALQLLRSAPVESNLVTLADTLAGFKPDDSDIKDYHTELAALLLATGPDKSADRAKAVLDLTAILQGMQKLLRPAEVVQVYATLCQANDEDRVTAIDTLEKAFRNKHPEKTAAATKTYDKLLTEEIKFRYPRAQLEAEFQKLRDYCEKFDPSDLVGLPLACLAEALTVQADNETAQNLLEKAKDLPQVGPEGLYVEFVRGRVYAASKDYATAVPYFDRALKPDAKLPWENAPRLQVAAKAYYESGTRGKTVQEKFPRLQRAVALLDSSKSDVPALYRFALADAAMQTTPVNAVIAREQSGKLLSDYQSFVKPADKAYAVRRIHATALAKLGEFEQAVGDFQVLVDSWNPAVKRPGDFQKEVLSPALEAARSWKAKNKNDAKCLNSVAGLLAASGRFLFRNRFDNGLAGSEKERMALSMKDFQEAADTYPTADERKAEYRTWQAYLLTLVQPMGTKEAIDGLRKLGDQVRAYSREYSGSYFIEGLALNWDTYRQPDDAAGGLDRARKAIRSLADAIRRGDKEKAPLLEYYYLTNSQAHLFLGNYLHTTCPAKADDYRKELQEAKKNAGLSIKDDENAWFGHLQVALSQEDIAWLGIEKDDPARTRAFQEAIKEYETSDNLYPRYTQTLVGIGRTYYRWITLAGGDRAKLKTADRALRDALATTRPGKEDAYYQAEARIWLVRVHLEMAREAARSGKEADLKLAGSELTTALKYQSDALETIPDALWVEWCNNLGTEIGVVSPTDVDNELGITTLKRIREQCGDLRKKGETLVAKQPRLGNNLIVKSYYYDANASLWLAGRVRGQNADEGTKLIESVPAMCETLLKHQPDWGDADPTNFIEALKLGNLALGGENVRKEDASQNIRIWLAITQVADRNKLHPSVRSLAYARLALARDNAHKDTDEERRQIIKEAKEALQLDEEASKEDPTGCQMKLEPNPAGGNWCFLIARLSWELWNSGDDDTKRTDLDLWEDADTYARKVGNYQVSTAVQQATDRLLKDLAGEKSKQKRKPKK